jgi:hypothetical protein
MKMQYKKLIIIISVATLVLGFFILTLIPSGKSGNDAFTPDDKSNPFHPSSDGATV